MVECGDPPAPPSPPAKLTSRRLRMMIVDFALLSKLFKLPDGAQIIDGMVTGEDFGFERISFMVHSDEFSPVPDKHPLPNVCPSYRRATGETGEFIDWNEEAPKDANTTA